MLVDTSVWIDLFRQNHSRQEKLLRAALEAQIVFVGDLILCETLQGFDTDAQASAALDKFRQFQIVSLAGTSAAIACEEHYRFLRTKGYTARKTIDVFVATWCITRGVPLLHRDRDFDAFEKHLGLKVVM